MSTHIPVKYSSTKGAGAFFKCPTPPSLRKDISHAKVVPIPHTKSSIIVLRTVHFSISIMLIYLIGLTSQLGTKPDPNGIIYNYDGVDPMFFQNHPRNRKTSI